MRRDDSSGKTSTFEVDFFGFRDQSRNPKNWIALSLALLAMTSMQRETTKGWIVLSLTLLAVFAMTEKTCFDVCTLRNDDAFCYEWRCCSRVSIKGAIFIFRFFSIFCLQTQKIFLIVASGGKKWVKVG